MEWKFATTLIGSLPNDDEKEAVDLIFGKNIDIPIWPQLPAKGFSESMYYQTGEKLPGLKTAGGKLTVDLSNYDPEAVYTAIMSDDKEYFQYPDDIFYGFHEFMRRDCSEFVAVKGHVTGCISEGLQITDLTSRAVVYDETYWEIVRHTVNLSAKWQCSKLKEKNPNVILFFDEPSLTMLGTPFVSISNDDAKRWINESLDEVNCHRAIHCCGNTNWEMVLGCDIDILSFDAYQYSDNLIAYSKELSEFYAKGGSIAWGIVPTSDENILRESAESLFGTMEAIFDKLESKGIGRELAASRSLLTPQCGLGTTSKDCAEKALDMLTSLSSMLRKKYGY